jgi:hypothetical protein
MEAYMGHGGAVMVSWYPQNRKWRDIGHYYKKTVMKPLLTEL